MTITRLRSGSPKATTLAVLLLLFVIFLAAAATTATATSAPLESQTDSIIAAPLRQRAVSQPATPGETNTDESAPLVVAPTSDCPGSDCWPLAAQQAGAAGEIISVVVTPHPVTAGGQLVFTVAARNTGSITWDPTGVEVEVLIGDEHGSQPATGWGTDAVPFEAVAPGAETSIVAYVQLPSDWQGTYEYSAKLWYLSTALDSYTGEDALVEVRPAQGPIEAYGEAALETAGQLAATGAGGGQAVNIVFAMDTSGSMDDEFSTLCGKIEEIVAGLQSQGISVLYEILGIAANRECTTGYVSGRIPGARSNHIEDWAPATYDLSYGYDWSLGYVWMIIPMSDEGPENGNPCEDPGTDRNAIADAIMAAQENGVIVSPVLGSWWSASEGPCITAVSYTHLTLPTTPYV